MYELDTVERTAVVRCIVGDNSIQACFHMTGVAKRTVTRLVVELGAACADYLSLTAGIKGPPHPTKRRSLATSRPAVRQAG